MTESNESKRASDSIAPDVSFGTFPPVYLILISIRTNSIRENPPQQIVEATGWYRRADGVVVLIADLPNTSNSSGIPTPGCQIPQ